jgi:outer membrane protein OmpA-like peptidoglycan-associated protein
MLHAIKRCYKASFEVVVSRKSGSGEKAHKASRGSYRSSELGETTMRLSLAGNRRLVLVMASLLLCSCSHKSSGPPNTSEAGSAASSSAPSNTAERSATKDAAGESAIVAAVRQKIESDEDIKSSKSIQISYANGIVKLTGKVDDSDEAWAAGDAALKVDGIQGIANCLTAEKYSWGSPARPVPSYEALIGAMLKAITSDPRFKGKVEIQFEPDSIFRLPNPPPNGHEGSFSVRGSVEDQEQNTAVINHMVKLSELAGSSAIDVLHDPLRRSTSNDPPPAWKNSATQDKPTVPLCPGLTVVTAIAGSGGDYESIKTIESVDARQVRLKYSTEHTSRPWWEGPQELRKELIFRNVLKSDLESAHRYGYIFEKDAPEATPGTTAIGTSADLLRELKANGETTLHLCLPYTLEGGCSATGTGVFSKLKRMENEPVRLRVLVNGVPADLPAVHAMEERGVARDEFFFLDDERNPLTLKFRLGIGSVPALDPRQQQECENARTKNQYFSIDALSPDTYPWSCDLPDGGDGNTLRVVKIDTRCVLSGGSSEATGLEKALADTGKIDIYSIYFSFNSAGIRDESEPTLKEIAQALRRHRDWKLRIAGHTDGVGSNEQNLDLSRRRAAAVKNALVKKYGIAPDRLATTGFGKSQPKDTNDTLEGRANNRRVELMKIL